MDIPERERKEGPQKTLGQEAGQEGNTEQRVPTNAHPTLSPELGAGVGVTTPLQGNTQPLTSGSSTLSQSAGTPQQSLLLTEK